MVLGGCNERVIVDIGGSTSEGWWRTAVCFGRLLVLVGGDQSRETFYRIWDSSEKLASHILHDF